MYSTDFSKNYIDIKYQVSISDNKCDLTGVNNTLVFKLKYFWFSFVRLQILSKAQ